jgi:hypothetical protein
MDTSDLDIVFDEKGVCNHCKSYEERLKSRIYNLEERETKLEIIVNRIKQSGKNKEYDEIITNFKKIHGDKYDYSLVNYVTQKEPITKSE